MTLLHIMIDDTILWIILFCFLICLLYFLVYFLVNLCYDFFNKNEGYILPE